MFCLTRPGFTRGKICRILLYPTSAKLTVYFERYEDHSKSAVCTAGRKGHIFKLASVLSEAMQLYKTRGTKQMKTLHASAVYLLNQTVRVLIRLVQGGGQNTFVYDTTY